MSGATAVAAAGVKIRVRDIAKRFGANRVLEGVDLDVPAGRSVVVIGGSGTGKSVLLKSILGIVRADAGSILVDGEEVARGGRGVMERLHGKTGMLFQGSALFDSLPVWHNVAFGLIATANLGRGEARERAIATMAQVNLGADVADRFPAELSGGMQKRVGLARAIAAGPEILFFDEPTTGLDPITAGVINELIRSCVTRLGATALSITHDMASVRHIADRVAMLHGGKIVWEGPVDAIDHSGSDYVDQFVNGRTEGPIVMPGQARG